MRLRHLFLLCAFLVQASIGPSRAFASESDANSIPRFIGFPVVIVNTSDGMRFTGLFAVSVRIKVVGQDAYKRVESERPRLQDAITQAAYRLGQLYVDPRKPIPWTHMVGEIDQSVKTIIPKENYKVLIIEATARPGE